MIAILYRTGARPVEICMMKKEDVRLTDTHIIFSLRTVKNGLPRNIGIKRSLAFVEDVIIPYVSSLQNGEKLFDFGPDRLRQIIYATSENKFTAYTFRHNRLTRLAEAGASSYQLMIWKGAKDMKSVSNYLYRSPLILNELDDVE